MYKLAYLSICSVKNIKTKSFSVIRKDKEINNGYCTSSFFQLSSVQNSEEMAGAINPMVACNDLVNLY